MVDCTEFSELSALRSICERPQDRPGPWSG